MILAIGTAVSRHSLAGKPSGGGTPPGRIYYTWGSDYAASGGPPFFEDRGDWSMNADGSDKRPAFVPRNDADLSHLLHQGHRWFVVANESPTNPDFSFGALFAVRDDGDPDITVLLLDNIAFQNWAPRWAKDDSFVSFDTYDEAGEVAQIWTVAVAFDDDGFPALAAAPFSAVAVSQAALGRHDFSPLADEVVYHLTAAGQDSLVVKNLVTKDSRVLLDRGESPSWSPAGDSIALRVPNVGIHVIRPDGTGLAALTSSTWGDYLGDWSPDGKHVVISRLLRKNGPGGSAIHSMDVMRVPVTGGSLVNLTKDIDGTAGALFWRQN
jgi:hypothetical protein